MRDGQRKPCRQERGVEFKGTPEGLYRLLLTFVLLLLDAELVPPGGVRRVTLDGSLLLENAL